LRFIVHQNYPNHKGLLTCEAGGRAGRA
jgi:hypothetical protein